jgi:hypothetical protein
MVGESNRYAYVRSCTVGTIWQLNYLTIKLF